MGHLMGPPYGLLRRRGLRGILSGNILGPLRERPHGAPRWLESSGAACGGRDVSPQPLVETESRAVAKSVSIMYQGV
jgi:hypothetical protein